MYKLYLVNHTQFQYTELGRSNFSQERCVFMLPGDWDNSDDMEMMTEFVFREKLKNRKKYELVPMISDPNDFIDDEAEESGKEDLKEEIRHLYISGKPKSPSN